MAGPMRLTGIAATLAWLARRGATGLGTDSRRLKAGDAFVAWPGAAHDGRAHVKAALAAGAPAALVEADGVEAWDFGDEPRVAAMADLKGATGELAAAWFGHPSDTLPVLAVTGTNGKTSTSWWIAGALAALGRRAEVVGTLGIGTPPDAVVGTGLTTPDPVALQAAFRRQADAGHDAVAIEASSIGIEEQRLAGTRIAVALFTNFTQDHLDYHGDMAAYWQAKARLFAWPGLKAAVVNVDDAQGAVLAQQLRAGSLELWTTAVARAAEELPLPLGEGGGEGRQAASASPDRAPHPSPLPGGEREPARARLTAHDVAYRDGGLVFNVREVPARAEGAEAAVATALIGDYNVANLLTVIGGLRAIGIPLADAAAACRGLRPVPGRMQRVDAPSAVAAATLPQIVVDYAHTPDALDHALQALAPLAAARGGALWCVFGCGGNRDARKRPLMGGIAERLARHVVLTSDNPRHEVPAAILADIVAGLARPEAATVIEDRRAAIDHALRLAAPADVVLVAGKGHEDYQEIAGERRPFSDVAVARDALARRVDGCAIDAVAPDAGAPGGGAALRLGGLAA